MVRHRQTPNPAQLGSPACRWARSCRRAPGYRLDVVELTWAPGAYATRHFHPTTLITCVQEGALGFVLQDGAATLTRGGTADAPGEPEPLALDTEVVLAPRDCITFDEFAVHMEHTGWNASDGMTVLWEARLLDPNQPFTTYVDETGHACAVVASADPDREVEPDG